MLTHNPLKYTKPEAVENKYKKGDLVTANDDPTKKLVIHHYSGRIYYCKAQEDPGAKELVFFERELVNEGQEGSK